MDKFVRPNNIMTVIIRDDGPMIHLNASPQYRTIQFRLTGEQLDQLNLKFVGVNNGLDHYEEIDRCFIEPGGVK